MRVLREKPMEIVECGREVKSKKREKMEDGERKRECDERDFEGDSVHFYRIKLRMA